MPKIHLKPNISSQDAPSYIPKTGSWLVPTLLRLFPIRQNIPLTETLKENIKHLSKLDQEDLLRTLKGTENPELIQYLESLPNR